MRFDRYPPKEKPTAPSRQRVAAAKRAVAKDRDKCGLFPEMMKHQSAEERLAANESERVAFWQTMRQHRANGWRNARRRLAGLPESKRRAVSLYWSRGICPSTPEYLADIITQCERGRCYWRALAELRRLALIGAGRLRAPWKSE